MLQEASSSSDWFRGARMEEAECRFLGYYLPARRRIFRGCVDKKRAFEIASSVARGGTLQLDDIPRIASLLLLKLSSERN